MDHIIVLGEGATGGDPDQKFAQNPIRIILDFAQIIVQFLTDVCLEKKKRKIMSLILLRRIA